MRKTNSISILALLTCLIVQLKTSAQCTITQPNILNPSVLPGGIAKFDLSFKHDRNNGNKWVTVHLWKNTDYPSYDYDRVPTTTRLGGASKRPFGTVVINNDIVDHSGIYNNVQAFAGAYQNDGTFTLLNTTGSTLIYNGNTDTYTLTNLQVVLPAGTTVLKYDSWSSQSLYNNNVHCFNCNAGTILVPTVLPVVYKNPFKAQVSGEHVIFNWTTNSEVNNSRFVVEELVDSTWKDIAVVFCKSENGFSDTAITYEFKLPKKQDKRAGEALVGLGVLIGALACRRFVPARLTILLFIVGAGAFGACEDLKGNEQESLQIDHWYRLRQIDKDGNFKHTDASMVKF